MSAPPPGGWRPTSTRYPLAYPKLSYRHQVTVRYAETDQMGVVHHANYILYLEEARTAYMAQLGCPYGAVEKRGVGLAVRKVEMRYRAPALYEDELTVHTRVSGVRAASVAFEYDIVRETDGTRIASGMTELACIDLEGSRSPRMLPVDLRKVLDRAHELDSDREKDA